MRAGLLTATVGLAAAAVAYAVCALVSSLLARFAARRGSSAALAVRLLPIVAALVVALAVVVPGFVLHEPAQANEVPGLVATGLAAAGLLLAGSLSRRAFRAWQATRRLLRHWERSAQPVEISAGPAPAFRIADPFPVVAVMGVLRPRLFVEGSVLKALSPAELSAVLEHEAAHLRARDNFKRWLMACAPSLGWRARAGALERAWENAAEHEADRCAHGALELASALVKTARLAPRGTRLHVPAAAFHGGGDVAHRVKELVEGPGPAPRLDWGTLLAAVAAGLVAAAPLAWSLAHRWAEVLIHLP